MLKEIIGVSLLLVSGSSIAAANGLSIHSRVNCVNNESISWDATNYHWLLTFSKHHTSKNYHIIGTNKEKTWRSAAVCWGEGTGGYTYVIGEHTLYDTAGVKTIWTKVTNVLDCSIYDGWWESDPPTGVSE